MTETYSERRAAHIGALRREFGTAEDGMPEALMRTGGVSLSEADVANIGRDLAHYAKSHMSGSVPSSDDAAIEAGYFFLDTLLAHLKTNPMAFMWKLDLHRAYATAVDHAAYRDTLRSADMFPGELVEESDEHGDQ